MIPRLLVLQVVIFVSIEYVSSQKSSPCPEVFSYEPRGTEEDRWYGVMSLRSPDDLKGVWLNVQLDKPAELLGDNRARYASKTNPVRVSVRFRPRRAIRQNWFGETVASSDNREFTISNQNYKLEAGPPVSVRFFVKYDTSTSAPNLQGIRLNGKLICSSQKPPSELGPTTPKLHISRPKTTRKPVVSGGSSVGRPVGTTGGRPGNRPSIHREPAMNIKPTSRPSTSNSIIGDVFDRPSYEEPEQNNQGMNYDTRPSVSNHNTGSNINRQPVYEQPSYNTDPSTSYPGSNVNRQPVYDKPSYNTDPSTSYPGSNVNRQPVHEQPSYNIDPSTSHSGLNSNDESTIYDDTYTNNQGQFPGSVSRPSSSNMNQGGAGLSSISLNHQQSSNRYPSGPGNNHGVINRPSSSRPVARPSGSNSNRGDNSNLVPAMNNQQQFNRPSSMENQNSNTLSAPDSDDDDFFPGDFANIKRPAQNKPSSRPQSPSVAATGSCGTVATRPSPLIFNGQDTTPGQWPWHAALYHSKGIQLIYTCGGTLISNQHVVTAAHCVTKPHSNKVVDVDTLLVYLGKYNLVTFGPEVQDRDVEDIFVHPEYNHSVYFNDIAVLKLSRPVETTNFVRPCCLWSEDSDLESIMSRPGTVVGWGFDESKKLSNKLMQAQMPVVSTVTCIYSNRDFFSQFTFEKNFCAGFRNGTSVCNGDSGGGMVFPKKGTRGQSTVWQLRGIVSVGVALQGQGICDTSQYIVFTDVAKYLPWIRQITSY